MGKKKGSDSNFTNLKQKGVFCKYSFKEYKRSHSKKTGKDIKKCFKSPQDLKKMLKLDTVIEKHIQKKNPYKPSLVEVKDLNESGPGASSAGSFKSSSSSELINISPSVTSSTHDLVENQTNGQLHNVSVARKTFALIFVLNVLVYLAWKVPDFQLFMVRYFLLSLTTAPAYWPFLLSVFSHYYFVHLALNMFALYSFLGRAISTQGWVQFLAMYLTAGVVGSFTSYLFKVVTKTAIGTLGASGAIMCVLAFVCSKYPHMKLVIICCPLCPFQARKGLIGFICLDSVGCLLRWGYIDHAAHLGGSLFGIAWFHWGHTIWRRREPLVVPV